MNKVKTKIYLQKTIDNCDMYNIEKVVCDLFKRFSSYREIITDMYILKAEKMLSIHKQQQKKYYYNSELNRTGKKRKKSQYELIERMKNNI